ncbi:general secretion pathway protein GspE [Aggregicoccus sp. 17bor-14]|uniref:GspE/PulE/PilB domain-containing protein n=1 Tax=Myxococcaceae TaxID=31 RepID=UPI00129C8CF8|nr:MULTISPECIES: general secretion pathway protein GspE [Myxococcaceae]MBF5040915.1 general secretion pathway protein GspE [Simulacricoccus sp. 17bor-14]MRI86703.1 general secretion pathway protein GspE [Aggregicoccus sp. 17bor-14]
MDAGLLTELQLKAALSEQRKWGGKLGRTLVEMGFVDEDSMAHALSRQLNIPVVDLDSLRLPPDVVQLLRIDVAERYGIFPLGGNPANKLLHVASSDPTNMEALQELSFQIGMRIQQSVSSASGIDRAIRRYYYGENTVASKTASPDSYGRQEMTFEPQAPRMAAPRAAPAPAGAPAAPAVDAEQQRRIEALTERVGALEQAVAGQVRALRALMELLVDTGVVRREEYLSRVRNPK